MVTTRLKIEDSEGNRQTATDQVSVGAGEEITHTMRADLTATYNEAGHKTVTATASAESDSTSTSCTFSVSSQ